MTLVAYADESGTHDPTGQHRGSEVAAVIGYVSWKDTWDLFCSEWQKVLNDYGIAVFHMSECMDKINGPKNPDWPYRDWNDTKRDTFIRSLIRVALDHTWFGVGGLLNVRDYDAVSPDWLKEDARHPYYFCSQLFFDALLPMLEKVSEPPLSPEEQVAFFFDQNRQFEDGALRAFHLIKALRDSKDRFGAIAFATRKQHKPLQAADLIAYIIRQAQTRRIREGHQDSWLSGIIPGSWEELLISKRNVNIAYFDASNLKTLIAELEKDRLRLLSGSNGSPVTAL